MAFDPDATKQLCRGITEAATHVSTRTDAIDAFAARIDVKEVLGESVAATSNPAAQVIKPECRVAETLAMNAINYCYFPDAGDARWWTVIDGTEVGRDDEAHGVVACLTRATSQGLDLGDAAALKALTAQHLSAIFAPAPGAGKLPMLAERAKCLNELGAAYEALGGVQGLLAKAGNSAVRLVQLLSGHCPGYHDARAAAGGEVVQFQKRAQLACAMLHAEGAVTFTDTERLTVFADYRLAQHSIIA
jgi:hypothetical protein